jgi:hypothetical protein
MTVNITFSATAAGYSMTDTQNSGSVTPSADPESDETTIYIRHDAQYAPITDCGWYLERCVSQSIDLDDPDAVLEEVLGWGETAGFGFLMNQEGEGTAAFESFEAASGSITNPKMLPKSAVTTGTPVNDGEIPVDGEAKVSVKWKVPEDATAGNRGVTLVFAYSATS